MPFDPKRDRDKKNLADLIMGRRNAVAADRNMHRNLNGEENENPFGGPPGLRTWGSMHAVHSALHGDL